MGNGLQMGTDKLLSNTYVQQNIKVAHKKDFIQKVSSKVLQRGKKDAKNIPKLQQKGFGQELAICKMQLALIKKWIKGIPKKKSKSGSSYS